MLADARGGAADGRALAVEGEGERDDVVVVAGQALDDAEGLGLRLRDRLGQGVDGAARDAARFQQVDPLALGAREEDRLQQLELSILDQ